MAWPSGTKASTANVDSPTDYIKDARADIKQNIDNVNSIIDTFNITTPSNGDVLRYSSTSGQWEQVASSAVGQSVAVVGLSTLVLGSYPALASTFEYKATHTVVSDRAGIIVDDSAGSIHLAAGSYIVESNVYLQDLDTEGNFVIWNEDSASALVTETTGPEISTTARRLLQIPMQEITLASDTEVGFYYGASNSQAGATPFDLTVKFTKVA